MAKPNPHLSKPLSNFLSTIEKYESCLGYGGFGVVLKAVDKFKNYTAVKFIFHTEESQRERYQILRECDIPLELENHENIVQTINAGENEITAKEMEAISNLLPQDARYTTMAKHIDRAKQNKTIQAICIRTELCGENLKQWLNINHHIEDIFVQLKQVTITQNIIAGVEYLHDNKLIHRDLKPANIMFSNRNYELPVKIGDFGLCRRIHSDQSQTNPLTEGVGTKSYMAPEIRSGNDYTSQADLFSLGLIIWEVVNFVKVSLFEKLVYDQNIGLVKEHEYMSGVRELIINLTKKGPEDRIKNMQDVVATIQTYWSKPVLLNKQITVRNTEELRLCFTFFLRHCQITALEGKYIGPFNLRGDNAKIVGSGVRTVFQGSNSRATCFLVLGNDCSISNLSIVLEQSDGILLKGSRNIVENIDFTGRSNQGLCLSVEGDENKLQKLKFSRAKDGIRIYGRKNVLHEICLENIDSRGIFVCLGLYKDNVITNVCGTNVRNGIVIHGANNHVSNVHLIKDSSEREFIALHLCGYNHHSTIENITCSGYQRDKGDWGLAIESKNSSVKDSQGGPVSVKGDNVTLTNIDCGDELSLGGKSTRGTRILKCRGKKLTILSDVTITEFNDCQFGSS